MADQKISQLATITGANMADNDKFVLVDTSGDVTVATTRVEFFKNTPSIDVTGTVTSDGLTVDGVATISSASGDSFVLNKSDGSGSPNIVFKSDGTQTARIATDGTNTIIFERGTTTALKIGGSTGDISFYEDTGTTAKFFWDASAERLGLGTSSPDYPLHVKGTTNILKLETSTDGRTQVGGYDSSGNANFLIGSSDSTNAEFWNYKNGYLRFATNSTERMRIDSSGNLLVGKTSADVATAGTCLRGATSSIFTVSGSVDTQVAIFNKTSVDGKILDFRKDGATVGSIGTESGRPFFASTACGVRLGGSDLLPANASGVATNGAMKLGGASTRWSDLYLSDTVYAGVRVCIGTTETPRPLTVNGLAGFRNSTTGFATSDGFDIGVGGSDAYIVQRENANIIIETNSSEAMRIDSSGRVGIGTSSPVEPLHVFKQLHSAPLLLEVENNGYLSGASAGIKLTAKHTNGASGSFQIENYQNNFRVLDDGTERMRIDSSGNLLVGRTSTSGSDAGFEARADGQIVGTRDGNRVAFLNRKTSDGDIVQFAKDGTTVGSIGTVGGDMYVGTGDTGIRFDDATNHIRPCGVSGANLDATIDIGDSSRRFKDVHAVNYYGDGSNLTGVGSSTTLGAVGTYAFLRTVAGVNITAGSSYAGSGLVYAGFSTGVTSSGTTVRTGTNPTTPIPQGSWRAMFGHTRYGANYASIGLFVRTS